MDASKQEGKETQARIGSLDDVLAYEPSGSTGDKRYFAAKDYLSGFTSETLDAYLRTIPLHKKVMYSLLGLLFRDSKSAAKYNGANAVLAARADKNLSSKFWRTVAEMFAMKK